MKAWLRPTGPMLVCREHGMSCRGTDPRDDIKTESVIRSIRAHLTPRCMCVLCAEDDQRKAEKIDREVNNTEAHLRLAEGGPSNAPVLAGATLARSLSSCGRNQRRRVGSHRCNESQAPLHSRDPPPPPEYGRNSARTLFAMGRIDLRFATSGRWQTVSGNGYGFRCRMGARWEDPGVRAAAWHLLAPGYGLGIPCVESGSKAAPRASDAQGHTWRDSSDAVIAAFGITMVVCMIRHRHIRQEVIRMATAITVRNARVTNLAR